MSVKLIRAKVIIDKNTNIAIRDKNNLLETKSKQDLTPGVF